METRLPAAVDYLVECVVDITDVLTIEAGNTFSNNAEGNIGSK